MIYSIWNFTYLCVCVRHVAISDLAKYGIFAQILTEYSLFKKSLTFDCNYVIKI